MNKSLLIFVFFVSFFFQLAMATEIEVLQTYKVSEKGKISASLVIPTKAYYGDLHLHSGQSFDAYRGFGYSTQEMAYRYAKGLEVQNGPDIIRSDRPLDFVALTDHAEYMGTWEYFEKYNLPPSWTYNKGSNSTVGLGTRIGIVNYMLVFMSAWLNIWNPFIDAIINRHHTWFENVRIADKYNEAGTFTTLPGFEWTDVLTRPAWVNNNHRVVIFESSVNLPYLALDAFSSWSLIEQRKPVKLWNYMDKYRDYTGKDVLAIPHNMNISNGNFASIPFLFPEYLERRQYNEPIMEVTQYIGQAMTDPSLVSNDEFSNYRIYNTLYALPGFFDEVSVKKGAYVVDFMKQGLGYMDDDMPNPFQTGFIGSTDKHYAVSDSSRFDSSINRRIDYNNGVTCLWATENTRSALFSALRRKETFATDGSRMQIRLFSGYHYPNNIDFNDNDWSDIGYEGGVPMGSEVNYFKSKSPKFLIWAMKDAEFSNLDRVQIIKLTSTGQKIYNAAWAGDRQLDGNGNLPPLVSNAELNSANYNDLNYGAVVLSKEWIDPDFNPNENAAYYLRVLEVPNQFSKEQRRGWSSPIYYNPNKLHNPYLFINRIEQAKKYSLEYKTIPNPISSSEKLYISSGKEELVNKIEIYNQNDILLFEKSYDNNKSKIVEADISGLLKPGVYYVIINKQIGKKIIVK